MNRYRAYSGQTTVNYEIFRVKDPENGVLRPMKEEDPEDIETLSFELVITGKSYFKPGKTTGPVDSCYPSEGEVDILTITDKDGKTWNGVLTSEEEGDILDLIDQSVAKKFENDNYFEPNDE